MNSGNPDMLLLEFAELHGAITAETAAALLEVNPNAAAKRLARLAADACLERAPYIPPRSYWHPYRPLGPQALMMRMSVSCFCVFSNPRWELLRWDGPAALCSNGKEKTAVFLDLGGTADHVTRKLRDFERTDGLSHFTILAPSDTKAEKLRTSAHRRALPILTRVLVISDLREMLFYETRKHARRR